MSQPRFRIPGPIGSDPGRLRDLEPDHRHLGAVGGAIHDRASPGNGATARSGHHPHEAGPAFPNIDRGDFYSSAQARAEHPGLISSLHSSLCGPAAFMYLVASNWPALYYQYVVDLYELGTSRINRLHVRPSRACRHSSHFGKMAAADWVALGGLRDSENSVLDYSDNSQDMAAITAAFTLVDWLERAGFHKVLSRTNMYLNKGEQNLREAAQLKKDGHQVCFLIDVRGIERNLSSRGLLPQLFTGFDKYHWVVLTSDIQFNDDGTLWFTVYTWGHDKWPVPHERGSPHYKMTLEQWLQNYYGYIACKP
jgi:hypothetical protein